MKAIGVKRFLPVTDPDCLVEFETDRPEPGEFDLLVKIMAVSVNPVDYKIRQTITKDTISGKPRILGWDAAGIVETVGPGVRLFQPGDEVYYAGALNRSGSNADYQVVDERIVGRKPKNLSFEQAASIPLTALTAWEAIFERLAIERGGGTGKTVLVIGGAGGVGSIAIQLLKKLTAIKVVATASRPESELWCRTLGADVVVNYQHLERELADQGCRQVDYILNLSNTDEYWELMAELIQPFGKICCIVPPRKDLNLGILYSKSVGFYWELMFTRSMFATWDINRQYHILQELADLLEQGVLKPTLGTVLHGFTADNFIRSHACLESGKTIGKIVVSNLPATE